MGLLSEKNKEVLLGPLSVNNPVIVQMLGICSALAVTSKLEPAIVMGISVTAVVAFANVIISLLYDARYPVDECICSANRLLCSGS